MSTIKNIEVASIKAMAEHEAKYGLLSPLNRKLFQLAFCDGAIWALDRSAEVLKGDEPA